MIYEEAETELDLHSNAKTKNIFTGTKPPPFSPKGLLLCGRFYVFFLNFLLTYWIF